MEVKECINYLKKLKKQIRYGEKRFLFYDLLVTQSILPKIIKCISSLQAENKALKKELKAYKGIVEDVRDIILHHIGHLEPNEVLDIIDNTSNKYLGGGE